MLLFFKNVSILLSFYIIQKLNVKRVSVKTKKWSLSLCPKFFFLFQYYIEVHIEMNECVQFLKNRSHKVSSKSKLRATPLKWIDYLDCSQLDREYQRVSTQLSGIAFFYLIVSILK